MSVVNLFPCDFFFEGRHAQFLAILRSLSIAMEVDPPQAEEDQISFVLVVGKQNQEVSRPVSSTVGELKAAIEQRLNLPAANQACCRCMCRHAWRLDRIPCPPCRSSCAEERR